MDEVYEAFHIDKKNVDSSISLPRLSKAPSGCLFTPAEDKLLKILLKRLKTASSGKPWKTCQSRFERLGKYIVFAEKGTVYTRTAAQLKNRAKNVLNVNKKRYKPADRAPVQKKRRRL